MVDQIRPFLDTLLVWGICGARIMGFCSTSVFFSSQYITGITRQGIVLVLSLMILPKVYMSAVVALSDDRCLFFLFLIKEVLLGIVLGWLTNFIFYAAQSVGFIIDTQRGASMASMFDPLSNSQTSPLGDFLMKFVLMLAFICGAFTMFLEGLYLSYDMIPVFKTFDFFKVNGIHFFNVKMGANLFQEIGLLGGPVVFILFLSEFGLGLVTRFAPQLNVFFLSMPIKSELAMFFFILYLSYLTRYFCTTFEKHDCSSLFLQLLLQ